MAPKPFSYRLTVWAEIPAGLADLCKYGNFVGQQICARMAWDNLDEKFKADDDPLRLVFVRAIADHRL